MYLVGHAVLALAAIQALTPFVSVRISTIFGLIGIAGGAGYFSWGYGRLLPRRPWIGAAGGFTALLLGLALGAFVLDRIVAVLGQGE